MPSGPPHRLRSGKGTEVTVHVAERVHHGFETSIVLPQSATGSRGRSSPRPAGLTSRYSGPYVSQAVLEL